MGQTAVDAIGVLQGRAKSYGGGFLQLNGRDDIGWFGLSASAEI